MQRIWRFWAPLEEAAGWLPDCNLAYACALRVKHCAECNGKMANQMERNMENEMATGIVGDHRDEY